MRESQVEKHLGRVVTQRGGLCWKFTSANLRGVPDRIVILPGGRVTFVELKAPGKTPKPHQERRHNELRQQGASVAVLDSIEAVDFWIGKM